MRGDSGEISHSFPKHWTNVVIPFENGFVSGDPDAYLELVLNPTSYTLRSFAFGGLPYYEKSGLYDQDYNQIVHDIKANVLTPLILGFFDGVDPEQIGDKLICYIVDSRGHLELKSSCVLR